MEQGQEEAMATSKKKLGRVSSSSSRVLSRALSSCKGSKVILLPLTLRWEKNERQGRRERIQELKHLQAFQESELESEKGRGKLRRWQRRLAFF